MSELIEKYEANPIAKVSLSDVTEHFKGKAVSKLGDTGNVSVVNLSDMTETDIDYDHLKKIDAEQDSVSRYLLEDGDVLIASKGTVKKVAVFHDQDRAIIASANITVLRPTADISGTYIKLFLESELGQELLETTNTGKNVMNLNVSIQIPKLQPLKQAFLIQRYEQGLKDYKRKITRANQEWQHIRDDVEKNLF